MSISKKYHYAIATSIYSVSGKGYKGYDEATKKVCVIHNSILSEIISKINTETKENVLEFIGKLIQQNGE